MSRKGINFLLTKSQMNINTYPQTKPKIQLS